MSDTCFSAGDMADAQAKAFRQGARITKYCGRMTDIVDRLRDDASITSEFVMTQEDYIKAADEIERMREDNGTLREALQRHMNESAKLLKLNDELIEALDGLFDEFGDFSFDINGINQARNIRAKVKAA